MGTVGVEGCGAGGASEVASKLTVVAPDSGQNLVTRTRPGGVLKVCSLPAFAVVRGSLVRVSVMGGGVVPCAEGWMVASAERGG